MGSLTIGQWVAVCCIGVGLAGMLEGIRQVYAETLARKAQAAYLRKIREYEGR